MTIAGSGNPFTVENGASVTTIAGQNIRYLPNTKVLAGGYLHGFISDQYCGQQPPSIPSTAAGTGEQITVRQSTVFTIYPNPTSGTFTVEQKSGMDYSRVTVEIYGMRGDRLQSVAMIREKHHEFNVSDLPAGLYFVKIVAEDHNETIKLVKTKLKA